ncbi:MAG: hypothetical protein IKF17_02205 [Clostridia bacterium]|nr:hypothetical protein [Clostridia bacterium]
MSVISIENLIGEYYTCINSMNRVYENYPILESNKNETIGRYVIRDLVDDTINSCIKELKTSFKVIKKEIKEIENLRKEFLKIDNMDSPDKLKQRWKRRKYDQINGKYKELENKLSSETRLMLEQSIHKTYALFHFRIAWIINQRAHELPNSFRKNYYRSKHSNMREGLEHALIGGLTSQKPRVRQDERSEECLYTNYNIPIPNGRRTIELHFGSEDNYKEVLRLVDGTLNNYILDDSETSYRAKLELRYLHRESQLSKDDHCSRMPRKGSDREIIEMYVIKYLYLKEKIEGINDKSKKEKTIEEMDNYKKILLKFCIDYPKSADAIIRIVQNTPVLNEGEQYNLEGLYIHLEDSLEIKNRLVKIDSKQGLIEFLKANIDIADNIQLVNKIINRDREFDDLLQITQKINAEEDPDKRGEIVEELIYRCVGMGTEGKDAFFLAEEGEEIPIKQISDFIKLQEIDIPDLEAKIEEAFIEKELLQSEGWDLGTEPLTQRRFAEVLKNGMIAHNMDFNHVDEAIEYYRKLDMLYGRDAEQSIETVKAKLDRALDKKEPENYEEMKEQPLSFTPEEAAEYYKQSDEFEVEYNRYIQSLESQSKPIGDD